MTEACNRVFSRFRKRKKGLGPAPRLGPQCPTAVEAARVTIQYWASQGQGQGQGKGRDRALQWAWKERWSQDL